MSPLIYLFLGILKLGYSRLEVYPKFHAAGVTMYASLSATECNVQYCGREGCHNGYPLTWVANGINDAKYVGSLFWLEVDTEYTVYVDCGNYTDPEDSATYVLTDYENEVFSTWSERHYPSLEEASKVLYVSLTGESSGCTSEVPCGLSQAISQITSGTHIVLYPGRYFEGEFNLYTHGTKEMPIVFRPLYETSDEDDQVILDGSEEITGWVDTTGERARGRIWQVDDYDREGVPNNVVIIHRVYGNITRLVRYYEREKFESLYYSSDVDGSPQMGYWSDYPTEPNIVELNIGNLSLSDYEVRFGCQAYGFHVAGDHYIFSNFTLQYYGWNDYKTGIYLRNGSYGWVRHMKFNHNGASIHLKMLSTDILVENNYFVDSKYYVSWDAIKLIPGDLQLEWGGIAVDTGMGEGISARGLTVRYNRFDDFFDALSVGATTYLYDGGDDHYNLPTSEVDVYDNLITRISDDGLECDALCQNVRVYNNRFHEVRVGISIAPAEVGPSYYISNVITDIEIGNTAIKNSYGVEVDQGSMYFFHNVVWNKERGFGVSMSHHTWKYMMYRNNIILGNWRAFCLNFDFVTPESPLSLDYDAVYAETGDLFSFEDLGVMSTLEEFQSLTGYEMNGVSVDDDNAVFEDDDTFVLDEESGLHGIGVHLYGINGRNPDLGVLFDHDLPTVKLKFQDDDDDVEYDTASKLCSFFVTFLFVLVFVF